MTFSEREASEVISTTANSVNANRAISYKL